MVDLLVTPDRIGEVATFWIRHVDFPKQVRANKVAPAVFRRKVGERGLSLSLGVDRIAELLGLEHYITEVSSGIAPSRFGLCFLRRSMFGVETGYSLEQSTPVKEDGSILHSYADLHHEMLYPDNEHDWFELQQALQEEVIAIGLFVEAVKAKQDNSGTKPDLLGSSSLGS